MKNKSTGLLLFLVLFLSANLYSQQWQTATLQHSSGLREYSIYVPSNYNPQNPASLVLTLHGLGDNMTNFRNIGFDVLAETNNIIVVCPQAIADPFAGTSWNSGAGLSLYTPNANVDDIGFLSSLIDKVKQNYSINPNKVFACGFSMGGFMTERLALVLNDKIKVFASVAGTFGNAILPVAAGTPGRPVSIAHFHGTADNTIGYTTNNYGSSVDTMISYWKTNNQSVSTPVHTLLPDTANDGYSVDHYKYTSTVNNSVIELFKVNNAGHTWLSSQNDISYTQKIWEFFTRNSSTLSINETSASVDFSMAPNPATDYVEFNFSSNNPNFGSATEIIINDLTGKTVLSKTFKPVDRKYRLNLRENALTSGVYLVTVKTGNGTDTIHKKLIVK
ncbi:T9SS type A sorting domain-containing protein [Chryseobacterium herbae]|uniref:T9SS type A sorting domain-containing protein n=1 Tax=Chryseobacterium herbae TaxID=2976476 RepID=A0ABT2ITG4_9FLAO|nr:T9SS type A sorting domain-containing protein [Chryseobacterium sp. pc1-10]MCT2562125.1 T9SS type A sorting domain-containing protein [Chryseobacterium sp. pc1-10]